MNKENFVQLTRLKKSDYYELIAALKKELEKDVIAPQIPPETLAKKVSENLITPGQAPIPDCMSCGICCFYAPIVSVSNSDPTPPENYWEIMLEDAASETVVNRTLRRTETECNYLGGKIKENVACRIYEVRPETCRAFEAGSDRCHAYRRLLNIEPPFTENELKIAAQKLQLNPFDEKITFVMITEKEVTERVFMTAEGFSGERKTSLLQITVFLGDDETPHILHQFNPDEENWLEDDFLAMTLEQAKELIASEKLESF